MLSELPKFAVNDSTVAASIISIVAAAEADDAVAVVAVCVRLSAVVATVILHLLVLKM